MLSSGMRIEGWNYLKWKHITPVYDDSGKVVAAKIIIYTGDKVKYYSFISGEENGRLAHGLTKCFKTKTEQVMKSINIEMLMGHYIGVSTSYYKPTEKEVLADFLKSIELLTFDPANKNIDKIKAEIRNEFEQMNLKIKQQQRQYRREILMIKLSNVIIENLKKI